MFTGDHKRSPARLQKLARLAREQVYAAADPADAEKLRGIAGNYEAEARMIEGKD